MQIAKPFPDFLVPAKTHTPQESFEDLDVTQLLEVVDQNAHLFADGARVVKSKARRLQLSFREVNHSALQFAAPVRNPKNGQAELLARK